MGTTKMLWTALPRSVEPGLLHISIFLAPRLETPGDGALADFTLGNWPATLADLALNVAFDGGATMPAVIDATPWRPALWDALFPPATLVEGFAFRDHSQRAIRSFPLRPILALIDQLYTSVAADPATGLAHPTLVGPGMRDTITIFGDAVDIIRDPDQTEAAAIGRLTARFGYDPALLDGLVGLYKMQGFYARPGHQEAYQARDVNDVPAPLTVPTMDFHRALAALADHPALLRALGLVIDVSLTLPLTPVSPMTGRLRVDGLAWGGGPSPTDADELPWTRFTLDNHHFRAEPRPGSDLANGLLRLDDKTRFDVFHVDVDGAGLKVLDFGGNLARQLALSPPSLAPDSATLPSLQGGGFTISRADRGPELAARLGVVADNNAMAFNPAQDIELWAEDVTRGYRVDVFDRGNWRSLCRRRVTHHVSGLAPIDVSDEGYVKGASATSSWQPGAPDDMYLHEALFGWDGWSLVAARPGQSISFERDDATKTQRIVLERVANTPQTPFDLEPVIVAEPASLPLLRFGTSYTFRARAVDLAGGGHAWDAQIGGLGGASERIRYLRHEPLAQPQLLLRAPVTAGESAERLVVRTQVGDGGLPAEIFSDVNERHVVPPKTNQQTAEQHGRFDGLMANPAASYALAVREGATLQDAWLDDIQLIGGNGAVAAWPADFKRGDALPQGHYVIHTGDVADMRYLPDPIALGAAFMASDMAGTPVGDVLYTYGGAWPDLEPFRLVLRSGADVAIVASGSTVEVRLPPSGMLTMRYSSLLDPSALGVMALWDRIPFAARDALQPAALAGQHWMLTPWRQLALVHAVERPIEAPELVDVEPQARARGTTWVELDGEIACHSNSTGEVAVDAEWDEPVDRLTDPGPTVDVREGHIFSRKIAYEAPLTPFELALRDFPRHEFGDTKHRLVRYLGVGTTRFREYFLPDITDEPANITLAGPLTPDVNVLSTERPDPPQVLYAVPAFKWEASADGKQSKRVGRGIRIYMDRPWYSSGEGELLAVLIKHPPREIDLFEPVTPPALARYISEWGQDPVWDRKGPSVDIRPSHFENAAISLDNLSLDEDESVTLTAVGFTPHYNADRQLWYADIVMDPGVAYYPFVRFALARLQPDSIANCHLSPVVRTEFCQLTADRTATIVGNRGSGGVSSVDVTVHGYSAVNNFGATLASAIPLDLPEIDGLAASNARAKQGKPGKTKPDKPFKPGKPDNLPGGYKGDEAAGYGHLVRAHVERRPSGSTNDLHWERGGADVWLKSYVLDGSEEVFWKGTVSWAPDSLHVWRLVITEHEVYDTDPDVAEPGVVDPKYLQVPARSRLAYVEAFPLGS